MSPPSVSRRAALVGAGGVLAGFGASTAKLGPDSIAAPADGADWPLVHRDARNTGFNPGASGPESDPRTRWTLDVYEPGDRFRGYLDAPAPAVVGDRVYVGGPDLSAHRVGDGRAVWSAGREREETFHGAAYAGGRLFVSTRRGTSSTPGVASFDAAPNAEARPRRRWRTKLDNWGVQAPLVAGDAVYVPTVDYLFALDRDSGRRRWRLEVSHRAARPAVTDAALYVPRGWKGLFARDRRRDLFAAMVGDPPRTRWRFRHQEDVAPAPAVGGGLVFVPETEEWYPVGDDDTGKLAAVGTDGAVRWREPVGSFGTPPVVADDAVFYKAGANVEKIDHGDWVEPRSDARVVAFDPADGTRRWTREFPDLGSWRIAPVSDGQRLYVPLHDNQSRSELVALDSSTGETRWRLKLDAPAYHLALAGETLYVSTYDGTLLSLS